MREAAASPPLPDVLLTPYSLRRRRESKGISVPAHVHAEGMLVLVHEGLVMVQSGDRVMTVLPGSLGWIPPGSFRTAFGMTPTRYLAGRA